MQRSMFIASIEGRTGKSTIALGLLDALRSRVSRIGVFRPVTQSRDVADHVVETLLTDPGVSHDHDTAIGVDYREFYDDRDRAMSTIVEKFHALKAQVDFVLVLGTDYTDVPTGDEAEVNAEIAANLGAPVALVLRGTDRTPGEIAEGAVRAVHQWYTDHAGPVAVVVNRAEAEECDEVRRVVAEALGEADHPTPVIAVLPQVPVLQAPTVGELMAACDGTLLRGSPALLERESLGFLVAAMTLPEVIRRLHEDVTVIAPGDRHEVLPGLIMAHQSVATPRLSSIVLTGGHHPPLTVLDLIDGLQIDLPIIVTGGDTWATTVNLSSVVGRIGPGSTVKIDTARRVFAENVDADALLDAIDVAESEVVTPTMFAHGLVERARADRRTIVLPEGGDLRVLTAADQVLRQGIADVVILQDADQDVVAAAEKEGLDIKEAHILSVNDDTLVERFAQEYAKLRAHKGVTVEQARDVVTDVSYFGTMMVHLGMADGMVSGAAHTTAHTIRPSFEIIKTKPGTKVVSSVFLMALADRVLVYGDCAVLPSPSAEELADVAVNAAATAENFGVEPRVAMLSYSTGSSGSGADVEKVREATALVRERAPQLPVEGPIQYDAAVDPSVAASKMPDSDVAGRATVLIFPDLNTGNNTYKAVQRSAGAVAMGPVLQGLNKPVNDLSRGALVEDIVNTVAITAIQAQAEAAAATTEGDRS